MKSRYLIAFSAVSAALLTAGTALSAAEPSPWGAFLKSTAKAAVVQLCPQAQQTVDQAGKLGAGQQENFLLTKAKEYLAARNFQPALDLANYVLALDPKSLEAQKILTDAKVALEKMAQDKIVQAQKAMAASVPPADVTAEAARQQVSQAQSGANKTIAGVNGLLGAFGAKK